MKYTICKEERPVYLQIYSQIRRDVISGVYPRGSKLPSKRLLAEELGVSTVTVEHAYALLCDEGYAQARQRSGYIVIFQRSDGFAAVPSLSLPLVHRPEPVYPDFSLSILSRTMRSVITDYAESILERSPNLGCLELREALRQYLARNRGIYVDMEQIVIGSGSEYLYGLLIMLLGRQRLFAIESPSYHKIQQVYEASQIRYELLPLAGDGIDSSALYVSKADVLHTTPYRSFPSGATASASKRHEYIRWAENGRYIIEDDFESEFSVSTKPTETLFSLSEQDNVIYLNTFSKTISPSLRVGYMVLPKFLSKQFAEKLGFYSCTVPTFMQLVLARLLNSGDFERHINRVRRTKRNEMKANPDKNI